MCSVVSDTPQKGHSGSCVFSLPCLYVLLTSFLNLMVVPPCAHLSCLVFASVFFIQLIRSCGGYSSRSLMSSSNAFFAASSALSYPVIPEWLGIYISLTLPFFWSSCSLIRLVFGCFVHLIPSTAIIVLRESVAITVASLPLDI
jgi:hypothetical protein